MNELDDAAWFDLKNGLLALLSAKEEDLFLDVDEEEMSMTEVTV